MYSSLKNSPCGGIGRHAGLTEASTRRTVKSCSPKKRVRVRFSLGAHIFLFIRPDGGMVDTAALGAVVARHVGSSPTWGTLDFLYFLDYLL